jgi:aminoglycoside 2'-N-acetyltransferase I
VVDVRVWRDDEVAADLLAAVRALTVAAFGGRFDEHDWAHTCGGIRVLVLDGARPVATAAVVPRVLVVGAQRFDAGYVEGVATAPDRAGEGLGARAMAEATQLVRDRHQLGGLSTGLQGYYERFGWERWRGPTYVRHADRLERTPGEDDGVMVLRVGPSADIDLTDPIVCESRAGDDW